MIGELIQTAHTYDEGRIAINYAFSGEVSFYGLSADTIYSGTTNLYDIFQVQGTDLNKTYIQNGINIFTAGTSDFPSVNITGASLNNLTVSGNTTLYGNIITDGDFSNTFVGHSVGSSNTTGIKNTFVGYYVGSSNTTGDSNTFLGNHAGQSNTAGNENTFLGCGAGADNTTGATNTFLGIGAGGSNTAGDGSVFIGNYAGQNETRSNRLYISNSETSTPLIYGEFDNNLLKVNGDLIVTGSTSAQTFYNPSFTVDTRIKSNEIGSLSALPNTNIIIGGNNTNDGIFVGGRASVDDSGPCFVGFKSRGTLASPSYPLFGDTLAGLKGSGYYYGDGSNGGWKVSELPGISIITSEDWSSGATGAAIKFSVTQTGATGTTTSFKLRTDTIGEFYSEIKLNAFSSSTKSEEGMIKYEGETGTFKGYTKSEWIDFCPPSSTQVLSIISNATMVEAKSLKITQSGATDGIYLPDVSTGILYLLQVSAGTVVLTSA